MKAIFAKNRATFQAGNGVAFIAISKVAEAYQEEMKVHTIEPALPIYYGNERQHTGVFAKV